MKNKNLVAITLLILVIVFIGLIYFYNTSLNKKVENIPSTKLSEIPYIRDYSPTFGENKRNIYIVEYLDPQCESCAIFHNFMKEFYKQNYGDIKLVIRYLANHRNSDFTIKILEASRLQNKYFEVLDVIYEKQPFWAEHNREKPELLWDFLKTVDGLDIEKLKIDMQNPDFKKRINLDMVDAQMLHITGTPTVFINGKMLEKLSLDGLEDLYIKEAYK